MFGTQFLQLDVSKGRGKCTKGIWLENSGGHLNIIDTEGSDSQETVAERPLMEQYVGLFAVSIADLFILNLWCKDIGRHDGGNYGVVKNIFYSALEVEKNAKKVMLFAIKDTPTDE